MRRTTLAIAGAVACLAGTAVAQSPIPENRVPGFGGTDARPSTVSPSATGSNVGSNVGAGASASPVINDPLPPGKANPETAEAPKPRPLIGLSREFASPPASKR